LKEELVRKDTYIAQQGQGIAPILTTGSPLTKADNQINLPNQEIQRLRDTIVRRDAYIAQQEKFIEDRDKLMDEYDEKFDEKFKEVEEAERVIDEKDEDIEEAERFAKEQAKFIDEELEVLAGTVEKMVENAEWEGKGEGIGRCCGAW